MTRSKTVTTLGGRVVGKQLCNRFPPDIGSLFSIHRYALRTLLCSSVMAGSLILAQSAAAGDKTGDNGDNGTPPTVGGTLNPVIGPDVPGGIVVNSGSNALVPGPDGQNGKDGTGEAANPGNNGSDGPANTNGGNGTNGGSANGGGGTGGTGASGTGRSVGPVDIIVGGNIVNGVKVTVIGDDGKGGKGGDGGKGEGGDNAIAKGGNGGQGGTTNPSDWGGRGGNGGSGGDASGFGGLGNDGAFGTGGSLGAITVKADGTINGGVEISATAGKGTGGAGGDGGTGKGGKAGAGGTGGLGGGALIFSSGNNAVGGLGGAGLRFGGSAAGVGGSAGRGELGTGGNVGNITVQAGGGISGNVRVKSIAGDGEGGAGGGGGNGTGGMAGAGGDGGKGGAIFGITADGSNNAGGNGGNGGIGGNAGGGGGNGKDAGNGVGGSTGAILIAPGGDLGGGIDIETRAGSAEGGVGGKGGEGKGGTAGTGGKGGDGGLVGPVASGDGNRGGEGGIGGSGGAAVGTGGDAGKGGNAIAGSSGAITVTLPGTVSGDIVIVTAGGDATGGIGGAGGSATATAGAGGNGGAGGAVGPISSGSNNIAGNGGAGGRGGRGGGGNPFSIGGNGADGGNATAGSAGAVDLTLSGATAKAVKITATGGAAIGGTGGAGGNGQGSAGPAGGLGGNGGAITAGAGNNGGNGGTGGRGGESGEGLGGKGGKGGDATGGNASVTLATKSAISTTGPAIDIVATGGAAKGGNGGTPGAGIGGTGIKGGSGGNAGQGGDNNGSGGTGGLGSNSGNGIGGNGGAGGAAIAGSAKVTVGNSGDITTTGGASAIKIVATGGAATGGNGAKGGYSDAQFGGQGGNGGDGGTGPSGKGGDGGQGGNSGSVTGSNGGDAGAAAGGSATVDITNDGRILSDGNGIDITATAGAAKAGSPGLGGNSSFADTGSPGGTGSSVGTIDGSNGLPGSGGTGSWGVDGASADEESSNGASAITVDNTNLIDVTGIGIKATANGDNGTIKVNNTGGTITGGLGGIVVVTAAGPAFIANSDIDIVNSGVIMAGNGMAINAKGASAEILNAGEVVGYIDLTAQDDTFDNQAGSVFAARSNSRFGAGSDIYNNLAGSMLDTADATGMVEEAEFSGIEQFRNNGLISMFDGGAGDKFTMSADAGDVAYSSSGGRVDVDAVLGDAVSGKSDLLIINGNVVASPTGPTTATQVAVNVVGLSGANADGIAVIDVTGDTVAGDFVLAGGPLNVGLFAWDLRLDDGGHVYELFTSGAGTGAYEFAAGLTATQDIWYQTTGTLLQRQADLRPLIAGTQVTPVADYSEPVAPTPAGQVGPGFWIKGVGAYLERDQGDGIDITDRKQSIYGGLAGFDFAAEGNGDAWLFGLFGGYLASDLKFKETDTKWTYDGPSVGAYATWLNEALHVDMLVKADFLSINIDPDAQGADDEDTDAFNLGGLIDAGYKFGSGEGVFVEPQVALAVVHTEIDDVDMLGGNIDFDEETSVRGRLGLRLGYDHTAANQVVYSSDVTASVWQEFNGASNDVSIGSPGFAGFGVSDDPGQTVGDISLGFSVAAPDGWSGFLRGNYQFSDDLEAVSGNAGVRYSW